MILIALELAKKWEAFLQGLPQAKEVELGSSSSDYSTVVARDGKTLTILDRVREDERSFSLVSRGPKQQLLSIQRRFDQLQLQLMKMKEKREPSNIGKSKWSSNK